MKNQPEIIGTDVAVCLDILQNEICAASHDSQGKLIVRRFPVRETIYAEISSWCESIGHKVTGATVFRFVPNLFMEQTRVAMLDGDVAALSDGDLTEWLVNAATKGTSGYDGKPVFETNLTKSAYDFTRLPNGFISLTELPREAMELTRQTLLQVVTPITNEELDNIRHYQKSALPEFTQAVEARLRVIARYLIETDRDFFNSLGEDETVAFFAFTPEGVGFALWNPGYGFHVELGDCFHLSVEDVLIPIGMDKAEYLGQLYRESVYNFLNDQFYRRIVPEDEATVPVKLKRSYWTAAANLVNPLEFLINEFSQETDFSFSHVAAPMEEMVVSGLLMGCAEETTEMVPAVNLANDITQQYQTVLEERQAISNQKLRVRRRLALVYVMLPVACAIGLVAGLILNNWRIGLSLDTRENAAKTEKARLQPLLNERADYEKTLSWFVDVVRQIVELRKKQTAALSFAARLDPLLPDSPAFYVSDMKLIPGGSFELRGLARDEFAVSDFVRQMEFATDDGGTRFFTGLTLEFKQGSQAETTSGAGSGVTGNLAPGISGFLVKGNFAPAGALKAQEAKPLPAPGAVPSAPVPAPPTGAPASSTTVTTLPVLPPAPANKGGSK